MERITASFDEHMKERNALFNEIQDNEIAIAALTKKPDVMAYFYLKNILYKSCGENNSILFNFNDYFDYFYYINIFKNRSYFLYKRYYYTLIIYS